MRLDPDVTRIFVCPHCGNALSFRQSEGATPEFFCACGRTYAVSKGIPRFVPPDNYAASFGMQWNRHRRTQLDSFTSRPISRERLFAATRWPERLDGQCVLEAGSGAGRFTEVLLSTGAFVYSFDYSTAVDANFASNGHSDHVVLFQGDIFNIPLKPSTFDKVLCLGVLQHTPDPARAFRSLVAQVRPGGELVVDLYAKRLTALVSWKYLLRPITKRMNAERLYRVVEGS